jgi:hypothetical protein
MDPRIQIRKRIHTKMSWIATFGCLSGGTRRNVRLVVALQVEAEQDAHQEGGRLPPARQAHQVQGMPLKGVDHEIEF